MDIIIYKYIKKCTNKVYNPLFCVYNVTIILYLTTLVQMHFGYLCINKSLRFHIINNDENKYDHYRGDMSPVSEKSGKRRPQVARRPDDNNCCQDRIRKAKIIR